MYRSKATKVYPPSRRCGRSPVERFYPISGGKRTGVGRSYLFLNVGLCDYRVPLDDSDV